MRSPVVEEIRQFGINEGPGGGEGEGLTSFNTAQRRKKGAFNAENHNYLYWPNATVPYAFHPYIGNSNLLIARLLQCMAVAMAS